MPWQNVNAVYPNSFTDHAFATLKITTNNITYFCRCRTLDVFHGIDFTDKTIHSLSFHRSLASEIEIFQLFRVMLQITFCTNQYYWNISTMTFYLRHKLQNDEQYSAKIETVYGHKKFLGVARHVGAKSFVKSDAVPSIISPFINLRESAYGTFSTNK